MVDKRLTQLIGAVPPLTNADQIYVVVGGATRKATIGSLPGTAIGTLGGDVTGPAVANTVEKIQGVAVASAAPAGASSLVYNPITARYEHVAPTQYFATGAAAAAAAAVTLFINGTKVVIYPGTTGAEAGTYNVTSNGGLAFPGDYTKVSDLTDTAAEVAIVDAGFYYPTNDVEAALQALPAGTVPVGKATNLVGGNNTTLLGSIPYQSNVDTTGLVNPNVTVTQKFLAMTGDGTNGGVPSWQAISTAITTGLTIWVDSVNGNDATGTRGRQDLPFLTLAAAKAAAGIASGDTIHVRPGTYTSTVNLYVAGVNWYFEEGVSLNFTTACPFDGASIGIYGHAVVATCTAASGLINGPGVAHFKSVAGIAAATSPLLSCLSGQLSVFVEENMTLTKYVFNCSGNLTLEVGGSITATLTVGHNNGLIYTQSGVTTVTVGQGITVTTGIVIDPLGGTTIVRAASLTSDYQVLQVATACTVRVEADLIVGALLVNQAAAIVEIVCREHDSNGLYCLRAQRGVTYYKAAYVHPKAGGTWASNLIEPGYNGNGGVVYFDVGLIDASVATLQAACIYADGEMYGRIDRIIASTNNASSMALDLDYSSSAHELTVGSISQTSTLAPAVKIATLGTLCLNVIGGIVSTSTNAVLLTDTSSGTVTINASYISGGGASGRGVYKSATGGSLVLNLNVRDYIKSALAEAVRVVGTTLTISCPVVQSVSGAVAVQADATVLTLMPGRYLGGAGIAAVNLLNSLTAKVLGAVFIGGSGATNSITGTATVKFLTPCSANLVAAATITQHVNALTVSADVT